MKSGLSRVIAQSVALFVFFALFFAVIAQADTLTDDGTLVSISQQNQDLPANDLVYAPKGSSSRILTPQDAQNLKTKSHVDLSLLNPDPTTDIWKPKSSVADSALDAALPIQSGETAQYQGTLQTSSGYFKMSVLPASAQGRPVTLMMGRTIHTFLLRKELLRRLGYQVPAIKYVAKLKIEFPDALTIGNIIKTTIPQQTQASPQRWCFMNPDALKADDKLACNPDPTITNPLEVDFQDMIAIDATPIIYNLALGTPIDPNTNNLQPSGGRLLRSLAVPFGLMNVAESYNQLTWYATTIDNQAVTMTTPDSAYFDCSWDDALWISRRMSSLTRQDFVNIVSAAQLPPAVAALLVEKLIARRNSVMKAFQLKVADIPYNDQVAMPPDLTSGKLTKQDWPGYASRFAWGDPDSPLKNIKHFFFSMAETELMTNLIAQFNLKLPGLRATDAVTKNNEKLQQQAISNYLQTGKNQAVKFGAWGAPLLNGGLTLSRSIEVGSYMGSDNMIQLADSYGYFLNAGLYVGFNGLKVNEGLSGQISGSISITYTHLKPITDLKQATSEPLNTLYVPKLLNSAGGIFSQVNALENNKTLTTDQVTTQITNDLDGLKSFIDVGESLIVTQSLSGSQGLTGTVADLSAPLDPSLSVGVGANQLVISRIYFYRKDFNTIMVYKDKGDLEGLTLTIIGSVGLPYSFPIVSINASRVTGSSASKIYTVNIDSSVQNNPSIFANAVGLQSALKDGSVEVLETATKPADLAVKFKDLSSTMSFLFWNRRTLKTQGQISVKMPDGSTGKYISLTDGAQTGTDYQTVASDVANFIVQKLVNSKNVGILDTSSSDPGHTYMGSSKTRDAEYQCRDDKGITSPYVKVKYRWEGWKMTAKDAVTLANQLSKQYGFTLYSKDFLQDTQILQLYDISLSVRFYAAGIQKVLGMTDSQVNQLVSVYGSQSGCGYQGGSPEIRKNPTMCEAIADFKAAVTQYHKGVANDLNRSTVIFSAMTNLESFMDFPSLVNLVGAQNMYVNSEIDGFRVGSETISDPIVSNALGIADPVAPEGVANNAETALGVEDGEFKVQWLREIL